jgi:hypothetical protein
VSDAYYWRQAATHIDGSPIFAKESDVKAERAVAARVSELWGCEVHWFGLLTAIDWYATRAGRLIGVLELKCRDHESTTFPTVFLNVRKWLALSMAEVGLGVPAVFVVQFRDGVWWVKVADIDARQHRIGGCKREMKFRDIEPIIEVPIRAMTKLQAAQTGNVA